MTDNAALFDEIMQWGGITPLRQPGDFTHSDFAVHIGRSESAAKRALNDLVDAGRLATEKRFDPTLQRNCRVYWVIEGGTPIGAEGVAVGVWGEGREASKAID